MPSLHNSENGSPLKRLLRFGLLRGNALRRNRPGTVSRLSRAQTSPARFRFSQHVSGAHRTSHAIAKIMIRDAQRLALAEGAGFGLGGMITLVPDAGLLTIITLRLIQRLCLLYGFEATGPMKNASCGWPPPRPPALISARIWLKSK